MSEEEYNEFVDVYLQDFYSVELHPNGKRIFTKRHQKVWEKNYYKLRAKGEEAKLSYYSQDNARLLRGRVNFNVNIGKFEVMTGDWLDQYPRLKEDIIIEFQLPTDNTVF